MVNEKEEEQRRINKMDRWLEKFFLDPLTSYFDEAAFRIDLFETADEYIVEALLPNYHRLDIEIYVERNNIKIRANKKEIGNDIKERVIMFPIPINAHEITAEYHDDVLEIFIAKNKFCEEKNRKVKIKE